MNNKLKNVSLLFAGVVIGLSISFSPEIQAAGSKLLGGKISKVINVNYNSKFIGEAPVINGTSYVPLRTAATELGLGIEVGKEINLTSPQSSTVPSLPEPSTSTAEPAVDNAEEIKQLTEQIEFLKSEIAKKEKEQIEIAEYIKSEPDSNSKDYESQNNIYITMKRKHDTNTRIMEMQRKNLAEYETKLAELQK